MNDFAKFLAKLGENPLLRLRFQQDEAATASAEGLSEPHALLCAEGAAHDFYAAAAVDASLPPKLIHFPQLIG